MYKPTPAVYESGRGLISLEGPSGMFINPTSATIAKGYSTLQYCMFLPQQNTDVVGNGFYGAYGITDWLEVGAIGKYIDVSDAGNLGGAGPFARLRLMKHDGLIPQLSIGGYAQFGDDPLTTYAMFSAAYWRIPINEDGFFRSLGVHTGVRENWYDIGSTDSFHAYGGLELELPYRLYAIGEVSTRDNDVDLVDTPYAYGLQWRLFGVNISIAGIQTGNLPKGPALYWGIGSGIQF